jgi:hypothetical protein
MNLAQSGASKTGKIAVDIVALEARGLCIGDDVAELSQFSIVTYERRPGQWRAAITPYRQSGGFILGRTTSSFVTPDDFASEPEAKSAAEKMIRKL